MCVYIHTFNVCIDTCVCVYMYIYISTHLCRIYIYIYTIHIKLDRFINYTHMCTCIFHLLITCLMITSMASRRGCLSYVFLWIAWTSLIFIIMTWWNFQDPCPSKKSNGVGFAPSVFMRRLSKILVMCICRGKTNHNWVHMPSMRWINYPLVN